MSLKKVIVTFALVALFSLAKSARAEDPGNQARAVFAGGCFWCMQPPFDHVDGVTTTVVGYAGGTQENPTYGQVSAGETTHRESIEVTYDPTKVTYDKLLEVFWRNINPVQTDGQFRDVGAQYTSAIFYTSEEQRNAAEASKEALAKSGKFDKPIATAILPATKFWPAEEYHQKYYLKNPLSYQFYHFVSGRDSFEHRVWGDAR